MWSILQLTQKSRAEFLQQGDGRVSIIWHHLILIIPFVSPDGSCHYNLLPRNPVHFLFEYNLSIPNGSCSTQACPSRFEKLAVQIELSLGLHQDALVEGSLPPSLVEDNRKLRVVSAGGAPNTKLSKDMECPDIEGNWLVGKDNLWVNITVPA